MNLTQPPHLNDMSRHTVPAAGQIFRSLTGRLGRFLREGLLFMIFGDHARLGDEGIRHMRQWVGSMFEVFARRFLVAVQIYCLIALSVSQFVTLGLGYYINLIALCVVLLLATFLHWYGRRRRIGGILQLFQFACFSAMQVSLIYVDSFHPYVDIGCSALVTASMILLTRAQYRTLWFLGILLAYALISMICLELSGKSNVYATVMFLQTTMFAVFAKLAIIRLMSERAVMDWFATQNIIHLEQEKYEAELRLAAAIQRSAMAQLRDEPLGPYRILTHHAPQRLVGGDWIGVGQQDPDNIFIGIGDATGKGMQAALLVHAVSALWRDAMLGAGFSPGDWLARVNQLLLTMGQEQAHSMTMAILHLRPEGVTYWSAGHLPMFALTGGGADRCRQYFGRGGMLGIGYDFAVEPLVLKWTELPGHLLLATDGINVSGRPGFRDARVLGAMVIQSGPAALESIYATDDDLSFVLITRAAGTVPHAA